MSRTLNLTILEGLYALHRLPPSAGIPDGCLTGGFGSVTRTGDELSIVCPEGIPVKGSKVTPGWACIRVASPLDPEQTGVLVGIAGALAGAGVSLLAVSTHDTDYILVKRENLPEARRALERAGHRFA